MRLRKIPHAEKYLQQAENVMRANTAMSLPLSSATATASKISLEIGCGKGDFIISQALAHPDIQYYALEKDGSILFKAVKKAETIKLNNLIFILGDAADLAQFFVPHSIDQIYLNFSDPWPKTRHAKRRLTYREKLAIYEKLLRATGYLELKTDSQSLFESSVQELSQAAWSIDRIALNLYATSAFTEIKAYQTEYEKKFIAKNQQIYYLRAFKKYE